jgi:hypothetical protein
MCLPWKSIEPPLLLLLWLLYLPAGVMTDGVVTGASAALRRVAAAPVAPWRARARASAACWRASSSAARTRSAERSS